MKTLILLLLSTLAYGQQNVLENLLIRGSTRPGLLRIADPFGKETHLFSIGADFAIKLHIDSVRQNYGSMIIQAAGRDIFRFKSNGTIQYNVADPAVFPARGVSLINGHKIYFLPVVDEVGNQFFIPMFGDSLKRMILN